MDIKRMDKVEFRYKNKIRKGIVIQNNIGNKYSPTTIVIEYKVLNRNIKLEKPYLILKDDKKNNRRKIALELTNIRTISKTRIIKKIGTCYYSKKVNNFLKNTYKNDSFDIVYANLCHTEGSEQSGLRPCAYIQKYNIVIPFTTQTKKINSLPTHTLVRKDKDNNLPHNSIIIAEHIRNIENKDINNHIGVIIDKNVVKRINKVIKVSITER